MKIVQRSPTTLVVHDSATFTRVAGALLIAFALSTRLLAWPPIPVPVYITFVLLLIGAACLLMSADSTYAVDTESRVFSMSRRYLLRPHTRHEVPLRDVVAIEVESSTDSDGDGVYRLVTRLQNGVTLPWTSSYSNVDLEQKREISHAAHQVMGVPAPAFRPVEKPAPTSSRAAIIVAALFCIAFGAIAGYAIWQGQRSAMPWAFVLLSVLCLAGLAMAWRRTTKQVRRHP